MDGHPGHVLEPHRQGGPRAHAHRVKVVHPVQGPVPFPSTATRFPPEPLVAGTALYWATETVAALDA